MGIQVDEYQYCDCCKRIFPKDHQLMSFAIPCRRYLRDGSRYAKGLMEVSFCETCFGIFWELSDKQFARVTQFLDEKKITPYFSSESKESEKKEEG